MFPEPCGGGLLLPAMPVLRTQEGQLVERRHSLRRRVGIGAAIQQERSAFEVTAPPIATNRAVKPVSGAAAGSAPSGPRRAGGTSDSWGLAPASSRTRAASVFPRGPRTAAP